MYARCGLQLLMPRLASSFEASGKVLGAWKRVIPVQHYTPLPYTVFVVMVSRMLAEGQDEGALLTWLTYHALLRPGGALLARISACSRH